MSESRRYFAQRPTDGTLPAVHRNYIQLPNNLSNRVQALSKQLIKPEQTVLEAAQRVESFLKRNLQYTLSLERDETLSPLDDFLFQQRRGHCEYFATAMAVLLRASGVATRLVNGFHGGKWNQFGNYVAVSHGDAHSWVEVATIREECKLEDCEQKLVCPFRPHANRKRPHSVSWRLGYYAPTRMPFACDGTNMLSNTM